ncbi:lytic transglycosylase domain-containing protein [Serinicoccus kebangsaanensis]|uniref:aggregation-promoting factor C-terminal-like domain-containing protein n=1 Tax=Serinicoccus kebangsaanensis TaxID=2602069 RepID=UPI001EE22855|nr:lytic transglycosylase domain-containing protein [Serinicoccus kebangsaanensis]
MSPAPTTDDQQARHARGRRMSPAAMAVTASIAAGSLGLATYAATAGSGAPQADAPNEALRASVGQFSPTVAADAVAALSDAAANESSGMFAEVRQMREDQAAALGLSTGMRDRSLSTVQDAADAVAQERAEKRRAEAEKAAREAAERAAAEQAAADAAAAEQAAADAAAAEQAAAERAAEQEQAASRDQARQAVQPQPEPAAQPVYSGDSRSIAQSMLGSYGWGMDQWGCLDSLWQKESGWNHTAMNPSSGAYGIPQSLPGSKMASAGADWQTNPATQIQWGLGYISGRYGSPCAAWAHSQAVNWY